MGQSSIDSSVWRGNANVLGVAQKGGVRYRALCNGRVHTTQAKACLLGCRCRKDIVGLSEGSLVSALAWRWLLQVAVV